MSRVLHHCRKQQLEYMQVITINIFKKRLVLKSNKKRQQILVKKTLRKTKKARFLGTWFKIQFLPFISTHWKAGKWWKYIKTSTGRKIPLPCVVSPNSQNKLKKSVDTSWEKMNYELGTNEKQFLDVTRKVVKWQHFITWKLEQANTGDSK